MGFFPTFCCDGRYEMQLHSAEILCDHKVHDFHFCSIMGLFREGEQRVCECSCFDMWLAWMQWISVLKNAMPG